MSFRWMFLITAIIVSFNEQTSVSYPVRVMLTHFTQMILVFVSRTLSVLVSAECCSTMVQMKQLTLRPLHGQCMLFFYSFFFSGWCLLMSGLLTNMYWNWIYLLIMLTKNSMWNGQVTGDVSENHVPVTCEYIICEMVFNIWLKFETCFI